MPTFYWLGTPARDVGVLVSYRTTATGDTVPDALPQESDTVEPHIDIDGFMPNTGTSPANWSSMSMSGNVSIGGSVTGASVILSGGAYSGPVDVFQITGGVFTHDSVKAGSIASGATFKNLELKSGAYMAGTVTVTGKLITQNGTFYAPTSPDVVSKTKVLEDNTNLGEEGTLTLPDEVDVAFGVEYGVGGNGSAGALEAGRISSPRGLWF